MTTTTPVTRPTMTTGLTTALSLSLLTSSPPLSLSPPPPPPPPPELRSRPFEFDWRSKDYRGLMKTKRKGSRRAKGSKRREMSAQKQLSFFPIAHPNFNLDLVDMVGDMKKHY
jgi:hypothetical protein